MSNASKFGILNSIMIFLLAIYIANSATGDGYWVLAIAAPISAFICGFCFWKLIVRKPTKNRKLKLILVGLLTAVFSPYLCWILLNIAMGNVWEMLTFGVVATVGALFIYGWITIPCSIAIGFLINRKDR